MEQNRLAYGRHNGNSRLGKSRLDMTASVFVRSGALVLFLTAGAKLVALWQHKPFLEVPDGVFSSLTTGGVLTVAAVLEIFVAVVMLSLASRLKALLVCGWFAAIITSYRFLAWALFAKQPCRCLGGILDWTGLPSAVLEKVPIILLVYLGLGSFSLLAFHGVPRWWPFSEHHLSRGKCKHRVPSKSFASLILLLSFLPGLDLFAEKGVHARGILAVKAYDGLGRFLAGNSSTNIFSVWLLRDGLWALETESLDEKKDTIYLTFDGSNTFFVYYSEKVIAPQQGRPTIIGTKPISESVHVAYISKGNYPFSPFEEQKRTHVLWLAYGIRTNNFGSKDIPLPWIPARWDLQSYGFETDKELLATFPYLPEKLRFVRSTRLDLANDDQEMDRPELDKPSGAPWIANWREQLQRRRTWWQPGFLAGELTSSEFVETNGIGLPMRFTFNAYHPRFKKGQPRWEYSANVTNISDLADSTVFRPPILAEVAVHDARFRIRDDNRALDQMNYNLRPGDQWPDETSESLTRQFQAMANSRSVARLRPGRERLKRIIVAGLFLIVACGIGVALYRAASRKNDAASDG